MDISNGDFMDNGGIIWLIMVNDGQKSGKHNGWFAKEWIFNGSSMINEMIIWFMIKIVG